METRASISPEILDDIVQRIVGAVQPNRILLFGSAAQGRIGPDSDVDLVVIMPDGIHRRHPTQDIYRSLTGLGIAKDIVVATESDIRDYGDNPSLVLFPALREGTEFYCDRRVGEFVCDALQHLEAEGQRYCHTVYTNTEVVTLMHRLREQGNSYARIAAHLNRAGHPTARGKSLKAMAVWSIANRLNNEGVPALRGKGNWQERTIGNLLAQKEKRSMNGEGRVLTMVAAKPPKMCMPLSLPG